MSNDIEKKDLFDVMKHGHAWYESKIEEEIKNVIASHHPGLTREHYLRWSNSENHNYIYDNDCWLTILNGSIEIKNERENVFNAGVERTIDIKNKVDVERAYKYFLSMTMEGEDEE